MFKKGDKVRLTNSKEFGNSGDILDLYPWLKGGIFEVSRDDDDSSLTEIIKPSNGQRLEFFRKRFELVPDSESFKVGDTVTIKVTGTISSLMGNSICIIPTDHSDGSIDRIWINRTAVISHTPKYKVGDQVTVSDNQIVSKGIIIAFTSRGIPLIEYGDGSVSVVTESERLHLSNK